MKFNIILIIARQVVIEVLDKGIYTIPQYGIYLDGVFHMVSTKAVQSIDNLCPDTAYSLRLKCGDNCSDWVQIRTKQEFVTLNVKDFGARGDGIQNDTVFIQSAISACPVNGRVLIPEGIFKVSSLFLKSNLILELKKGAVLSALTDRDQFPVLPGLIESYDETDEYNLGTWEGNPLDMFSAVITGIQVKNVILCGQGILDGNADFTNWWNKPKEKKKAYRPRMIFLNRCENITIQGITVQNSPSWSIHPYFSESLKFMDLVIKNPKDSPNTDGIDPESCKNVEITGVYFSLGDDCIAIKSGKIYMGSKYKTPSENILIRQCYMEHGHGSVTIGSEMAGGVRQVTVKNCIFFRTDRGFRLKLRRGRGKDGIIDNILLEHIIMEEVMTPISINSFYHCDPDGHSEYVGSKEALPVDDGTPGINKLTFRDIICKNCHVAAAFIYGLPEKKIGKIVMENVTMEFAPSPVPGIPDMLDGIEKITNSGIFAANIVELELIQVAVKGCKGKGLMLYGIDYLRIDQATNENMSEERKEQL